VKRWKIIRLQLENKGKRCFPFFDGANYSLTELGWGVSEENLTQGEKKTRTVLSLTTSAFWVTRESSRNRSRGFLEFDSRKGR